MNGCHLGEKWVCGCSFGHSSKGSCGEYPLADRGGCFCIGFSGGSVVRVRLGGFLLVM